MAIEQGIVAFVRFSDDVEWDAMDDMPVRNAMVLIMPDKAGDNQHLKMIAKLARLLIHQSFIDELN